MKVTETFFLFCILSSSVYILNDIVDRRADRQHPFKKKRPIASGKLSVSTALTAMVSGLSISLLLGWLISPFILLMVLAYVGLQLSYSFYFKHKPILDVLSIAAGFMIRVYAGLIVVNLHMSVWFLLTVISASLFLAIGKRQSERTLLSNQKQKLATTRKSLAKYSTRLLDIYTGMFANATWLTYALFAFQQENMITTGEIPTILSYAPRAFIAQKWLMLTVPVAIYGVMRYLQLVYESNEGESPERVLLRDKPLLGAVVLWAVMVMVIIYFLEGLAL